MIRAPFVYPQDATRYLNEITAKGYVATFDYRNDLWVVTARKEVAS